MELAWHDPGYVVQAEPEVKHNAMICAEVSLTTNTIILRDSNSLQHVTQSKDHCECT